MAPRHPSQQETIDRLDELAPGAPLLALGQTVFWDEPMKGFLSEIAHGRELVVGIHDTDYFAKLPGRIADDGEFKLLPHNDTTTRGFWSAAGEFSALFGAEVVLTREALVRHGAKVARVAHERPELLDEATEAWRWRGVVSRDRKDRTVAQLAARPVVDALYKGLDWALEESLDVISGIQRDAARDAAGNLRKAFCDAADGAEGVADVFETLLPRMYELSVESQAPVTTTRTTRLLRFNIETCRLPRFELVDHFLRDADARRHYDESVAEGAYTLDRFGSGALPFDLYSPKHGRGTLRLGRRGGVAMFPRPVGFRFDSTIEGVEDLARVIEETFGGGCALVGKAVTLIGMLAREFVFVFHEGASTYVSLSRELHKRLDWDAKLNPILRVGYEPWDALESTEAWFVLPEPLRGAFGCKEISGPSFAHRWREVGKQHEALLEKLSELRRPTQLIAYLQEAEGGAWNQLAEEFESTREVLKGLSQRLEGLRKERATARREQKRLIQERIERERASGKHWRARLFEAADPAPEDLKERQRLQAQIQATLNKLTDLKIVWQELHDRQERLVSEPVIERARHRRRDIALEAEIERIRLVRRAVVVTKGLRHAGNRPSAWWFPIVSPGGEWFVATTRGAALRLEALR